MKRNVCWSEKTSGWWLVSHIFLECSPRFFWGRWFSILTVAYFSKGWFNHQLDMGWNGMKSWNIEMKLLARRVVGWLFFGLVFSGCRPAIIQRPKQILSLKIVVFGLIFEIFSRNYLKWGNSFLLKLKFNEAFKDDFLFHFTLKVFVEGVIFLVFFLGTTRFVGKKIPFRTTESPSPTFDLAPWNLRTPPSSWRVITSSITSRAFQRCKRPTYARKLCKFETTSQVSKDLTRLCFEKNIYISTYYWNIYIASGNCWRHRPEVI